jgi:DNA-binding response OmpR family regulator
MMGNDWKNPGSYLSAVALRLPHTRTLLPKAEDAVQTSVLVIDDDVEMTDLLQIILEPGMFQVSVANSGPVGVELARKLSPDVIILDMLMPGMDGWQVCKEIRAFSRAPILILSAVSKPGMVARALDEGADDFLIKPMPSGVLIAHLKKLTRRARAERDAANPRMKFAL